MDSVRSGGRAVGVRARPGLAPQAGHVAKGASDEIEKIFARGDTENGEEYGVFLKLKSQKEGDIGQ